MDLRFLFWMRWAIEKYLDVEIKAENFEVVGIIPAIIVVIAAYLILVQFNFFSVIDSMNQLSNQQWFLGIMAKLSFLSIFIKIISLSLFTNKNDPIGRFVAAFVTQLVGLVGTTMCHILLNTIVAMPNGISQIKTIYGLLPFIISIVVYFVVSGIYKIEYFDSRKFFGKNNQL